MPCDQELENFHRTCSRPIAGSLIWPLVLNPGCTLEPWGMGSLGKILIPGPLSRDSGFSKYYLLNSLVILGDTKEYFC